MLMNVIWRNFQKESDLDRPEMFQRLDEIKLDSYLDNQKMIEEMMREKLATHFKLPVEKIQIINYHATEKVES